MRRKFILLLASKLVEKPEPAPKTARPMFRANHHGPGARNGTADPEATRQLALSITQETLLKAGHITWAAAKLTPCVVTLKPNSRATNDPAKT